MNTSIRNIFQYQIWQWLSAIILIAIMQLIISFDKNILEGMLWNISTNTWFWIAISIPILHQLYVWLIWRLELYQNTFSLYYGQKKAFKIYKAIFSVLFISRLIFISILAFSNSASLNINSVLIYFLVTVISPAPIYLFYSVKKYFSIDRAFGLDHFEKNFNRPYVKQGVFRYTDNGMYIFGLMILYFPGLLLFSKAALLVALFNHVFIWAHFYCTERPDMKKIYDL